MLRGFKLLLCLLPLTSGVPDKQNHAPLKLLLLLAPARRVLSFCRAYFISYPPLQGFTCPPPSQEHRLLRVDDDMPQRVGDVAAAGVPHELRRRQEVAVADADYPDLLAFPVLVQEAIGLAPAGPLRLVGDHRHVLHHAVPEVAGAGRPHRQRPQRPQRRLIAAGGATR